MRRYLFAFPGHPEVESTRCLVVDLDSMREHGPTAASTVLETLPWPNKTGTWKPQALDRLAAKHQCVGVRVIATTFYGRIAVREKHEWLVCKPYGLASPAMCEEMLLRGSDA